MPGSTCSTNPKHTDVVEQKSAPPSTDCQGTVAAKAAGHSRSLGWGTELQPWDVWAWGVGRQSRVTDKALSLFFLHAMDHGDLISPPGNLNRMDVTEESLAARCSTVN